MAGNSMFSLVSKQKKKDEACLPIPFNYESISIEVQYDMCWLALVKRKENLVFKLAVWNLKK
jgi:hypothetical protein